MSQVPVYAFSNILCIVVTLLVSQELIFKVLSDEQSRNIEFIAVAPWNRENPMSPKKLRGVLSSLVKKKVFIEDLIQGDTWFSPEKPAFFFGSYFCRDNYEGNQIDDCDMEKVYDAIK